MIEIIKKHLRIILVIWTVFMIMGSILFIYNIRESLVLVGNSVILLWMMLFYLVLNDTPNSLMFVLKTEIFLMVSYCYVTSFFILFHILFEHKIFGKHGEKAYMFNALGMLIHFLLFFTSRRGPEVGYRVAADTPLVVRREAFGENH